MRERYFHSQELTKVYYFCTRHTCETCTTKEIWRSISININDILTTYRRTVSRWTFAGRHIHVLMWYHKASSHKLIIINICMHATIWDGDTMSIYLSAVDSIEEEKCNFTLFIVASVFLEKDKIVLCTLDWLMRTAKKNHQFFYLHLASNFSAFHLQVAWGFEYLIIA